MKFINSCNHQLLRKSTKIDLSGIILTYREKEVEDEENMPDTQEIKALIELLNKHPEVNTLELENCSLFDRHIKLFTEGLQFISDINLRGNAITTTGLESLLKLKNIKKIDLRNAHFSGDEKKWDEIINLIPPTLIALNLDGNRAILGDIKDKVYAKIQENIAKLKLPAGQKNDPQPSSSQTSAFFQPMPQAVSPVLAEEFRRVEENLLSTLRKFPKAQQPSILDCLHKDLDAFARRDSPELKG